MAKRQSKHNTKKSSHKAKQTRRILSESEEFDIMKLVLDKFLWFGFIIMAYGLFLAINDPVFGFAKGLKFIVSGAVVLIIFMIIIVKEFEIIRR